MSYCGQVSEALVPFSCRFGSHSPETRSSPTKTQWRPKSGCTYCHVRQATFATLFRHWRRQHGTLPTSFYVLLLHLPYLPSFCSFSLSSSSSSANLVRNHFGSMLRLLPVPRDASSQNGCGQGHCRLRHSRNSDLEDALLPGCPATFACDIFVTLSSEMP